MMRYGVIASYTLAGAADSAGADYLEPTIAGSIIIKDGERWVAGGVERPDAGFPSFAILFPGEMRLSDPQVSHGVAEEYLREVFAELSRLGVEGAKVVFGSGAARAIPDAVSPAEGRGAFAESLRLAHELGTQHGLEVLLEPLNRSESNLIHSIQEAIEFLDEFEMQYVRVVADLYHIMLEGEELEVVSRLGHRIGHAHVADTGRTPPGTGNWPIREFLAALAEGGYRGDLTIECTFGDFEPELRDALKFLRAL